MVRAISRPEPARARGRRGLAWLALACVVGGATWGAWPGRDPVRPAPVAAAGPGAFLPIPGPAVQAVAPPTAGTVVALDRIELAPSGSVVAVLRINAGESRRHALGDALAPGVRLARIAPDSATIERDGVLERLPLPAGVAPVRPERVTAATAPPRLSATLPRPATPQVVQLLDAPPGPGVVAPSPERANPARGAIARLVAAEALRLQGP